MKKILLPGELLVDKYTVDGSIIEKVGGAPANVAFAIQKNSSASAVLESCIGNDNYGGIIKMKIKELGFTDSIITVKDMPTTLALVEVDRKGERKFLFERGADKELETCFNDLKNFDMVHLGSATAFLGGELEKSYFKLFNMARKEQKLISFDPNFRVDLHKDIDKFVTKSKIIIANADVVKLSEEELSIITGANSLKDGVDYITKMGARIVLVTLGAKGSYISVDGRTKIVKSIDVKQVDSTGAGDCFIGYFIGQYVNMPKANFDELTRMVLVANIAAALVVTKIGGFVSIPGMSEVMKKVGVENG